MNARINTFYVGQMVRTRSLRHVIMWSKRWPIVLREERKIVSIEPQGVLLDDNLYYPQSELTPI